MTKQEIDSTDSGETNLAAAKKLGWRVAYFCDRALAHCEKCAEKFDWVDFVESDIFPDGLCDMAHDEDDEDDEEYDPIKEHGAYEY